VQKIKDNLQQMDKQLYQLKEQVKKLGEEKETCEKR
jgi:hypothetical protein